MDKDKTGFINHDELRAAMMEVDNQLNDAEIN